MLQINYIKFISSQFKNTIKTNSPLSFPASKKEGNQQNQNHEYPTNQTQLNFNFFNEYNSPFSNTNICSKKTNEYSMKDSKYISNVLTRNDDDDKNESFDSKSSNEGSNRKNIFGILSKHLIYQSSDSEKNKTDSSEDDNENDDDNFNIPINKNKEYEEEEEFDDTKKKIIDDKNKNNDDEIINKNYVGLSQDIQLIINNFLSLAKEQFSCRFLQQKINSEPYIVKYIFPLILNHINELIIHPYGNYLIQHIFFYLSENDIIKFIEVTKNDIVNISKDFFGTRVIQKLLDFIHNQNTMLMLLNSYNDYSIIANDIFASHIILKLLSLNQMYITSFIYEKINKDLVNISINRHGCCIIKKILEYKSSFNDTIINNIINNAMQLITDQYGHYIILYIIQSNMRVYKQKLILMILPHFIQLSLQIYSSSVLEKCFEFCEEDIKEMLYPVLGNTNTLKLLICDKYGNYVIQKAILKATNENMQFYLFRLINSIINDIKKDSIGKQFYLKLRNSFPNFKKCLN